MINTFSTITKFKLTIKFIYPNELELKKENDYLCKASFLNLSIEFHDSKFTIEVFYKRDTFSFYTNHIPYLDSSLKSKKAN